jgi:hypothetical protein
MVCWSKLLIQLKTSMTPTITLTGFTNIAFSLSWHSMYLGVISHLDLAEGDNAKIVLMPSNCDVFSFEQPGSDLEHLKIVLGTRFLIKKLDIFVFFFSV